MSHALAVCHGAFGRAALYELDRTIKIHAHREGHLIFHVAGDPANIVVNDSRSALTPGHAIAVSPWEPHSFHVKEGQISTCLVLYIKPMWFLENSEMAEFSLCFGRSHLTLSPVQRELLTRITVLLMSDENAMAFDDLLFSLTQECFSQSWDQRGSRQPSALRRLADFRVRRSLRLIQQSVGEEMPIDEVARSVGLSRPHFFKLFKQFMGLTPNVYINTLLSENAIQTLLNTPKSVTDIAFDLGFSSQASFTRFFSSNVGIAPSEYRRVAHVAADAFPMMGDRTRLSGMPPRLGTS